IEPYGKDGWGWVGEIEGGLDLDTAIQTCKQMFDDNGYYYPLGKKEVQRVVALSGSGAPRSDDYVWLMENKIDLFITGEPREWNQELCRETGISFVAGGHYNSERLGVQALGAIIQNQFDVDVQFVDVPNLA
ncbi:MAG: Nif3-like dinuclear metal center hexameric protein, partial [Chloroflexota bacterium]